MMNNHNISRETVLRDFSVEFDIDKNTLIKYLTEFPEYAEDLIDLSRALTQEFDDNILLTSTDEQTVESAKKRFRNRLTQQAVEVEIPPQCFLAAAKLLNLPKQVLMAFGGKRIELTSVPLHFLNSLASSLQVTITQLEAFLKMPPQASTGRSYKSNVKPLAPSRGTFEKILRDAQVSDERIQELTKREE